MEDAARPGRAARRVLQLGVDPFGQLRVVADQQRAQLVDRMAQGAGQCAAKIGDPNPLGAAIGADPHPDDRALAVGVGGGAGERLVGRQIDDAGADRGNFHRIALSGLGEETQRSANRIQTPSPADTSTPSATIATLAVPNSSNPSTRTTMPR